MVGLVCWGAAAAAAPQQPPSIPRTPLPLAEQMRYTYLTMNTPTPQTMPTPVSTAFTTTRDALWRYRKLLGAAAALLVVFFIIQRLFFQPTIVTVIGQGSVMAEPASVELVVTHVESSLDPVVAVNLAEDGTQNLIDEVKKIAGEASIQRSFYQLTPTIIGGDKIYQVVNAFQVKANTPEQTSELIKALYTAGATTVTNVVFVPADQDKLTDEVRKAAVKDARDQARRIAKATGKRVGRMVTITDDLTQAGGVLSAKETSGADTISPDFTVSAPQSLELQKAVSVTYELW